MWNTGIPVSEETTYQDFGPKPDFQPIVKAEAAHDLGRISGSDLLFGISARIGRYGSTEKKRFRQGSHR